MTHPRTSRLRRYVLGDADATERLLVEEHLPSCVRCRAFVDQHARLDQWIIESCPVPDSHQSTRTAFDRLWVEVDSQSTAPAVPAATSRTVVPVTPMHWPRRPAILLLSTALAASLVLGGLWWLATLPGSSPPGASPVAQAPEAPVLDQADRIDPARLTAVRTQLAAVLCSAQSRHPDDDAAFSAACAAHVRSLRADGWPVQNLVRVLAQSGDDAVALAALHFALGDGSCDAALAEALTRPAWRATVLERLAAPSSAATTRRLASAVISALATLATAAPDDTAAALRVQAVTTLARDAGPAARAAVTRVLQRVAAQCGDGVDTLQTLQSVFAAAPADLAVCALLESAQERTSHKSAAACFAALAEGDPARWGASLASVLPRLPPAQLATGALWAQAVRLSSVLPALRNALDAAPGAGPVLDAVVALGGPEVVLQLHALVEGARTQPIEKPLQAALLRCLTDTDAACVTLATALAGQRASQLEALADSLPPPRRAALLLAGLRSLADTVQMRDTRATLLTALARLGDAEAGQRLIEWIATRPRTDRVIALAWTTATRLDLQAACHEWQRAGGDPALLVAVASDRTAWPNAAPSPPASLLRQVDRSLRRIATGTPEAPASSSAAPAATLGPASKETL